jgi:hypothetical protein
MKAPVLIIGAHRSGTSATAHALELLGLQIGQRVDSHFEPKVLQQLHEEYLIRIGASWHNPAPFLDRMKTSAGHSDCFEYLRSNVDSHFGKIFGYRNNPGGWWRRLRLKFGAPWGWKEPRTTLFAPIWLEIFPDARIVHVVRDIQAAAESIRERELRFQAAGDSPTPNVGDLDYCRQLVELYLSAGEDVANSSNYKRIQFEELQANPPAMLEQLAIFCGLRPTTGQLAAAAASIRPAQTTSRTI